MAARSFHPIPLTQLNASFFEWLAERPEDTSTKRIYSSLWEKMIDCLNTTGGDLSHVSPHLISTCLDSVEITEGKRSIAQADFELFFTQFNSSSPISQAQVQEGGEGTPSPDNLANWINEPRAAFASWLDIQQLEESSKKVYRALWGKFVKWMEVNGQPLDQCSSHHLAAFLDESGLHKGIRQRYVRLVERAFNHLDGIGLRIPNPGKEAAFGYVGSGKNDPMRCLDHQEREKLFAGIRAEWEQVEEGAK